MRPPLVIRTLGGLAIEIDGARADGAAAQPRRLALVALIARAGERGITREKLLSLLWPDSEPELGRRALNQALYALRRDLGTEELVLGVHELRLNPGAAVCDVQLFEADHKAGRLEAAVARYAGPFLDGFRMPGASDFERWADDERTELGHRYASALERLARAATGRNDAADAVRWWRRRAALDPLDARTAEALMRALVANGDAAAALQHARIYEVLVAQELDLPADGSVLELARRIRAGEVAPPERPVEPVVAPAAVAVPEVAEPAAVAPDVGPDVALVAAAPALAIAPGDAPRVAPAVAIASATDGIAVLPFANLTGDDDSAHLCDGVAEEIIHALAGVVGVRVVARSASFAFSGPAVDLGEVGARLGVAAVLEGCVRRCGDRVRVTARLVNVVTREPVWAEREDGVLGDTFAVQDALAARVVARLASGPVHAGPSNDSGQQVPARAARPAALVAAAIEAGAPTSNGCGQARRSGGGLVIAR